MSSEKIEKLYYELVSRVREVTPIPLAVKIGHQFTNLPAVVNNLYVRGARGVVLFNRFYEPDIDIGNLKLTSSDVFSSPSDIRQSLRWVGIISDKVEKIDIAASTGVHDGKACDQADPGWRQSCTDMLGFVQERGRTGRGDP